MKVYMILSKTYFKSANGNEYQVPDGLQPITVYSNQKKAYEAMKDIEKYFAKRGYQRKDKYNNLFPVEHFQMTKDDYRVVIYKLDEEVQ